MVINFDDCSRDGSSVFLTETPELLHITMEGIPYGEEMTVTLSPADAVKLREWLDRIPVAASGT